MMSHISENEGGDNGGGELGTSVDNIASYPSLMLKKALKRNNVMTVDKKVFKQIGSMVEDDIITSFNLKAPCLISCGKKHLLVSKK